MDHIRNWFEQRETRRRGLRPFKGTRWVFFDPHSSHINRGSGYVKEQAPHPRDRDVTGVRARVSREKSRDVEKGTVDGGICDLGGITHGGT